MAAFLLPSRLSTDYLHNVGAKPPECVLATDMLGLFLIHKVRS